MIAHAVAAALAAASPRPPTDVGGSTAPAPKAVLLLHAGSGVDGTTAAAARDAIAAALAEAGVLATTPDETEAALSAAPAEAASAADVKRAIGLVDDARAAYASLRFGVANEALRKARQLLRNNATTLASLDALVDAHLWRAAVLKAQGRGPQSDDELTSAALLAPQRKLDAATYPPDIVSAFGRVQADVRALPTASLSIKSTPPGAVVEVDALMRGRTPVSLQRLPRGEHLLVLRRTGHAMYAAWFTAQSDEIAPMEIFLDPHPTFSRLAAAPGETVEPYAKPADAAREGRLILATASALGSRLGVRVFVRSGGKWRGPVDAVGDPPDYAAAARAVAEIWRSPAAAAGDVRSYVPLWKLQPAATAPASVAAAPPPPQPPGKPWYGRPWVWIGAAVLLAGAGTTAYFVTRPPPDTGFKIRLDRL